MAPDSEPFGYADFLCDVNVEFGPGGKLSNSISNRQNFKLKHLPYLIPLQQQQYQKIPQNQSDSPRHQINGSNEQNIDNIELDSDHASSSSNTTTDFTYNDTKNNNHYNGSSKKNHGRVIDVTEESYAFLGSSDFVPTNHLKNRRVVIELISAKLSQASSYNVPLNGDLNSNRDSNPPLERLDECSLSSQQQLNNRSFNDCQINMSRSSSFSSRNSITSGSIPRNSTAQLNTSASFTNSSLSQNPNSLVVGNKRYVNYTLLIKTVPGLDKHPTVIERRFSDFSTLYHAIRNQQSLAKLIDNKHLTFPKKVLVGNYSFPNIAERGIEFSRLLNVCMNEPQLQWSAPFTSFLVDKELREAHKIVICGDPDDVLAPVEIAYGIQLKIYLPFIRERESAPLCKRLLVTIAMLIFTYYRAGNYVELNKTVILFRDLVEWPELVKIIKGGRYYSILSACINFLGDIEQQQQQQQNCTLKPELTNWLNQNKSLLTNGSDKKTAVRRDLITLFRDRNFCSFQDGALSLQES